MVIPLLRPLQLSGVTVGDEDAVEAVADPCSQLLCAGDSLTFLQIRKCCRCPPFKSCSITTSTLKSLRDRKFKRWKRMTRLTIPVSEIFFWRKWITAKASGLRAPNSKTKLNQSYMSPSLTRMTLQLFLLSKILVNSNQIKSWPVRNNCFMCHLIQ